MSKEVVGVLALQGDFAKHIEMLNRLGVQAKEVRKPEELDSCDRLILPGGESTTIWRQMQFIGLLEKITDFAKNKPVFGTCAGLILMSRKVLGIGPQPFGLLDIEIERNAFGRQADSFETTISLHIKEKDASQFRAVFIRAPRIQSCGNEVKVLAQYKEEPVLVQQGVFLGASFHPELTSDGSIHSYFLSL